MGKIEIRQEAVSRQGKTVGRFHIPGGSSRAEFEMGGEGLVHLAVDTSTGKKFRIKCFWEPTKTRLERTRVLVREKLASRGKKSADALAGAPLDILDALGPHTPFAVLMKNVLGRSWAVLRERAQAADDYPPKDWPTLEIRAVWAYGLATAVRNMEGRGFVHADLSPGNVMLTPSGDMAGDMALVDFDAFVHPAYNLLDSTCRGCQGYAAPEIWLEKFVEPGSDRIGMAILIQEFIVIGDPDIDASEAFSWAYDQVSELCSANADCHPVLHKKYPELAELVVSTLRETNPKLRPHPDLWRRALASIAQRTLSPSPVGQALEFVSLDNAVRIVFAVTDIKLDLLCGPFAIRATLMRDSNRVISILVNTGAEIRVRAPNTGNWIVKTGGAVVVVVDGMTIHDPQGKLSAIVRGK